MKVLSLAAAALMGSISTLSSPCEAVSLTGKQLNDLQLTSKLMENARYYSGGTGEQQRQQERGLSDSFEITAAHTILFRSCESLTVHAEFGNGNDDGISDTIKSMYQSGQVKAQKSYILFDVCLSEYCDSGNAADRTTFITDMASFINAFLEFIPAKTQAYCQGCFDNQDFCMSGSTVYNSNSNSNNGGRRKLSDYELVEYIDCNQCQSFGCYTGAYANVDYSLEWIQSMTSCTQSNTPTYFNGAEITTGFMCNEAGDGVEIAAFLDNYCTLYTNQVAYGNLLTGSEYKYWYNSKTHIEYMFNVGYSCYNPTIMYINPSDEAAGTYGDNYKPNMGDYYVPAVADYCSNVFENSNTGVVEIGTCSDSSSHGGSEYVADGGEDYFQQVYTLAEEDINDGYAVCAALMGMGGSGEHLYEKSASGAMYKYSGGAKTSANWQQINNKESGVKGGWIAFLVLFMLGAAAGGGYYYHKKQEESKQEKKSPLVDINNGKDNKLDLDDAFA